MKIGLVGAGSMGYEHTTAWKTLAAQGAELVGILASPGGSADKLAQQHGLQVYASYADLLKAVDVVDICVPTDMHPALTIQAAAAGKHVICEKPIALTVKDGRAMIDACQKAGVRLFIAQVLRFFPQYKAAQAVVAAGDIGKLGVIRLTRASYMPLKPAGNWFTDETRSGGMVVDLMIHDFDYARWIGGNVTRVFAKSVRSQRPDAPGEYALVTLRFADGALGHIEGGWAYPPGNFRTSMDIAGTLGVIEWTSDNSDPLHTYFMARAAGDIAEVGLPLAQGADNPYALQIQHFYRALVNNTPFSVTPEAALAALEISLAARESLKTGRAVTINQEAV